MYACPPPFIGQVSVPHRSRQSHLSKVESASTASGKTNSSRFPEDSH